MTPTCSSPALPFHPVLFSHDAFAAAFGKESYGNPE